MAIWWAFGGTDGQRFAVQSRWGIPECHGAARPGKTVARKGQNQLWKEFHSSWAKEGISRAVSWSLHAASNQALGSSIDVVPPKASGWEHCSISGGPQKPGPHKPQPARNHYAICWDWWLDKTLPFVGVSGVQCFLCILLEHAPLMMRGDRQEEVLWHVYS